MFLDRDGVLNRAFVRNGKPFPPSTVDEVELLPGNSHACEALRQAGFLLIMVTNQPDVARGTQSRDVVEAINQSVAERLHLDLIKVCYHDDVDDCSCRKPKPGLLYEAADELQIDLSRSFMIGDRWKDIEAGRLAGCQTILIQTPYAERRAEAATQEVDSLSAAADFILRITHTQGEG